MRHRKWSVRAWLWSSTAAVVVSLAAAGDEPKPETKPKAPVVEGLCVDIQPQSNHLLEDDFSETYPGNNLRSLPVGKGTFGGTRFEVGKAVVRVRGDGRDALPAKVEGIPVGAKAGALVFLHGTEYRVNVGNGGDSGEVGAYLVHYADGTEARVPLVYGRDFVDWWAYPGAKGPTHAKVGWRGTNPAAEDFAQGISIRLYTTAWVNPHPDKEVATVDVVSKETMCQPFLVALTALPPGVSPPALDPDEPADVPDLPPAKKEVMIGRGAARAEAVAPGLLDVPLAKQVAPAPAPAKQEAYEAKGPAARGETLVDLQGKANHLREDDLTGGLPGNDLRRVPGGVQTLAGVRFRIGRGVVRVQGNVEAELAGFPRKVEGIGVNAKAGRLVFLHATVFSEDPGAGVEVATYVVHYSDGASRRVPVVYGREIADWWATGSAPAPTAAKVAWDGTNDYLADAGPNEGFAAGMKVRLYATAWDNPDPDKTIATVDLVSAETRCQPFLAGLTALPPAAGVKPVDAVKAKAEPAK